MALATKEKLVMLTGHFEIFLTKTVQSMTAHVIQASWSLGWWRQVVWKHGLRLNS